MPELSICWLGPIAVTIDGRRLKFRTRKAQALLAYLTTEAALSGHEPVRRETLLGLLWPDYPERSARQSLRTNLSYLKKGLGSPGATKDEASVSFLLSDSQQVQMNPVTPYKLDLGSFTDLVSHTVTHQHDDLSACDTCQAKLEEAVSFYRGDFLADFYVEDSSEFEAWVSARREYFRRQVFTALDALAEAGAARGAFETAARYARRQLEIDPLRESAHRQLMLALARQGRRRAALAHYESLVATLQNEMGITPSVGTTEIAGAIRAGDELPVAGTDDIVAAQEMAAVPSRRIDNLPSLPTSFQGRERELADLSELLVDPEVRLLTLLGPGGVGKTRLALAAAGALLKGTDQPASLNCCPDGLIFVPMQPLAVAENLTPAIATALDLNFSPVGDPIQQLVDHIREKQLLLILDNFEHLLEATELVQQMLSAAPRVKIMVTSRVALNLYDEWLYHLNGMPYPEDESGGDLMAYDAVRLFVERARRTRRGFTLDQDNTHVVEICRLVEGMPLAIELATTWLKRLPCADVVAEIRHGLDILSSDMRGTPSHHRSMRVVFDHSWKLLEAEESQLLEQLSIFRGGFTWDAAQLVASASLPALAALVDKSMLTLTEEGRYHIHELQRQFAAEKLAQDPSQEDQVRNRHCHYYTGMLDRPLGDFYGPRGRETVAAIHQEIDNVRMAWQWAIDQSRVSDLRKAIEGIYQFSWLQNWHQEGYAALRQAVDALQTLPPGTESEVALGYALSALAAMDIWLDNRERALELARKGLGTLRGHDAPRELAKSLTINLWLAIVGPELRPEEVEALSAETLPLLEELRQFERLGFIYELLSLYSLRTGNGAERERWLLKAQALAREIGDQRTIASTLGDLALVALRNGSFEKARQLAHESFETAQLNELLPIAEDALGLLARVCLAMGEPEAARQHADQGMTTARLTGKEGEIGLAMLIAAEVCLAQGETLLADEYLREAQQLLAGAKNHWPMLYFGLGQIALQRTDYMQAQQCFLKGLEHSQRRADRWEMARHHLALANVALKLGHIKSARHSFREALQRASAIEAAPLTLDAIMGVALLFVREGESETAFDLARLVAHHSATRADTKARANRLLRRMEELPGSDRLGETSQGRRQQDLEAITAHLCAQLDGDIVPD